MRILIPDAQFRGDPDIERSVFGPDAVIDVYRAREAREVPETVWRRAEAIILYHEVRIGPPELAPMANCRILVRAGVGFDNIDAAAAGARGLPVCNTPDYGTTDVADHAMAMLLTLTRGTAVYDEALRRDPIGGWDFARPPALRRLSGQVFGVIGLGRIGTATALRARAFGMDVVFYDPYRPDGTELALGLRRHRKVDDLFAEADIVSLHAPLTSETWGLIGADAVAAMKPGAILVNTARGALVDTAAVLEGLRAGRLAAAALDVLPVEPPDAADPLVTAWRRGEAWLNGRLLLSPHAAFYSAASFQDLRRKSAETARDFLNEGMLRNCVNEAYLGWPAQAVSGRS